MILSRSKRKNAAKKTATKAAKRAKKDNNHI
jgi:hypothetical protein